MPASDAFTVTYNTPATDLIRRRFSCRSYSPEPIEAEARRILGREIAAIDSGPLGSRLRFLLIAASKEDLDALRGLGTYGFIRGATGFVIGTASPSEKYLEDFGYRMEQAVLRAADLGLGSCWLGGTFAQSNFARKASLHKGEELPAVVSIGRIADEQAAKRAAMRRLAGSIHRLSWERLFFRESFSSPLRREEAGPYAEALEMVRLGPSASNKQPWRILYSGGDWHFYLQRTPGYREGFFQRILRLTDLQRIDMGIAMCHFELAAREAGLRGRWAGRKPPVAKPDGLSEYCITWTP
jgi:nitroreductase